MKFTIDNDWVISSDPDKDQWVLEKRGKEYASDPDLCTLALTLKNLLLRADPATTMAGVNIALTEIDAKLAASIPSDLLSR